MLSGEQADLGAWAEASICLACSDCAPISPSALLFGWAVSSTWSMLCSSVLWALVFPILAHLHWHIWPLSCITPAFTHWIQLDVTHVLQEESLTEGRTLQAAVLFLAALSENSYCHQLSRAHGYAAVQISEKEVHYFMAFELSWYFCKFVLPKHDKNVLQNTVSPELQYWTDAHKVFSHLP